MRGYQLPVARSKYHSFNEMNRKQAAVALRVLWVDDDRDLTLGLADYLRGIGYEVECAHDLADAGRRLAASAFDLVLVDLDLPDGSGFSLVRDTPRSQAREFVVVTGHGSLRTAVEALRHQVFDYLLKPVELAELCNLLTRVSHAREPGLPARGAGIQEGMASGAQHAELSQLLIGASPAMQRVRDLVQQAASSDITVLMQGESGTGKEVVANCLHQLSNRAAGPFVAFNCGAVSPSLIASELFGHEKGSFTGAHRTRRGVFERANGGTLFLDEITEMPLDLQASLLRVLEAGTVTRVGGDGELPVSVRIVAATNRDPLLEVEQGRFRLDLYYRLQVFPVTLPPLRQRTGDVLLLAEHFLKQLSAGKPLRFSPSALDVLVRHGWPGNARELRNVVERACLLASDVIGPEHLLLEASAAAPPGPAAAAAAVEVPARAASGSLLRDVEEDLILRTLDECGGNKTRAAARLGISLKTLYNKLSRFRDRKLAQPPVTAGHGDDGA
jgi:DNA-binding NtrC family response regulator